MQLTKILIAAVTILAYAESHHPPYFNYNQQNKAARAVGSGTNDDFGSGNDCDSDSGTTGTGTGTTGNDVSSVVSQGSQSSGLNTGTHIDVSLKKAASLKSQSSGSGSTGSGNGAGGSVASFTQYGGCRRTSVACGWYSKTGYNAAISQAVYGGGPGSGATAECGVCWRLTPDGPGTNEIVVKINDLCPDENNPICAQPAGEFSSLLLCHFDSYWLELC